MISFTTVSFSYDGRPAVAELSLSINKGETFGIIGPNGSGKTTILKLLSGVLEPDKGHILFDGKDLRFYGREELARKVAVVPQETTIDFPFTVCEAVLMGRAPHLKGFAFERERDFIIVRQAMERTAVSSLAARSIHEVSGGEKQRVIIARALAQEPEVLLLDEPTAFLDIRSQVEICDLIRDLNTERGLTVISTLHDLNLAALYCDRLALLTKGRLYCVGIPEDVLTYTNIKTVYETEVFVDRNSVTGKITVLPLSREYRERIHGERSW